MSHVCPIKLYGMQELSGKSAVCLQHLYAELGVDLGERAYGADCRLYIEGQGINWPVIKATVFDEFVVAHTLGWWGKVDFEGCPTAEQPTTAVAVQLEHAAHNIKWPEHMAEHRLKGGLLCLFRR